MSNKRQRAKISLSSEPVGKEWFIYYTPHPTKHNGYVCKFCPSGSKLYSQVKGAGCGNLGKHMKSQHSADIIPYLKHHRLTKGAEDYGNSLDNYAGFIGPRISERGLNIYNWLEFVIFEDHPMVRKHSKLTAIS
jgi:hypothetical protein